MRIGNITCPNYVCHFHMNTERFPMDDIGSEVKYILTHIHTRRNIWYGINGTKEPTINENGKYSIRLCKVNVET